MPDALKKKIDLYSASVILSPKLPAYVKDDAARKIVIAVLKRHPSWGLTPEVQDTPAQYDAVVALVSAKLTDRRYSVKKLIADSVGKASEDPQDIRREDADDIITLCNTLVKKVFKRANVVVTVPMCGRVAFLRQVYIEHPKAGDKFWSTVDKSLHDFRVTFPNEAQLSSAIGRILTQDRLVYGTIEDGDLEAIAANAGTEQGVQRESEDVISGTASSVAPTDEADDSDSSDED